MKYTDLCEHLERMARRDRDGATQAISRLAKRLHEANAERLEQAAAAIRELEARVEGLGREVNMARYGQPDFAWSIHKEAMAEMTARAETAEAKVARLLDANWRLRSYAVHDNECKVNKPPHFDVTKCSCGLRAALTEGTPE